MCARSSDKLLSRYRALFFGGIDDSSGMVNSLRDVRRLSPCFERDFDGS
jgi:hypothetical protein